MASAASTSSGPLRIFLAAGAVSIFVCSRPQCVGVVREDVDGTDGASSPGSKREGETGEAEERLELGGV